MRGPLCVIVEPLFVKDLTVSKRTVLITGASRNIGAHLARRYAAEGHDVVAVARKRENLEEIRQEVESAGGSIETFGCDVSDPEAVEEMVSSISVGHGGIDVLINNAVIRVQRPVMEMTFEEWKLVQAVTLDGAFNCIRAVLPGMRERGWGRIISMGGISAAKGATNRLGVVTCKAGLQGLTRGLANETAAEGITVNLIAPGRIGTDRGRWTAIGDMSDIKQHYNRDQAGTPMGRMGDLDEIAAPIQFLTSEEASFITGQTLCVNGGTYFS